MYTFFIASTVPHTNTTNTLHLFISTLVSLLSHPLHLHTNALHSLPLTLSYSVPKANPAQYLISPALKHISHTHIDPLNNINFSFNSYILHTHAHSLILFTLATLLPCKPIISGCCNTSTFHTVFQSSHFYMSHGKSRH